MACLGQLGPIRWSGALEHLAAIKVHWQPPQIGLLTQEKQAVEGSATTRNTIQLQNREGSKLKPIEMIGLTFKNGSYVMVVK